jgi:16S rRNA (guanine527-N7)-methyltransferase
MAPRRPADSALLDIRGPEDFAAAFPVSAAALERLAAYERLLRQWQKAINLVAPSTLEAVWHRHFADCAQLLPLAPEARSWLDLGSGAGFPGLVLAILLADAPAPSSTASPPRRAEGAPPARRGEGVSGLQRLRSTPPLAPPPCGEGEGDPVGAAPAPPRVTLVESDQRKCAFLREAARQTGISVDILSTRAESLATQANLAAPDVVTARALAPLDRLLGLAAPLSPPSTVGLYFKGREAAKEIEAAEKTWQFNAELVPSRTDAQARIVVVRHLQRKAKD